MLHNSVVFLFSRNMLFRALRYESAGLYFKLFQNEIMYIQRSKTCKYRHMFHEDDQNR